MEVLNINVGILGHVDSGKTSLVKALSTVLSTASLDKNPQVRLLLLWILQTTIGDMSSLALRALCTHGF